MVNSMLCVFYNNENKRGKKTNVSQCVSSVSLVQWNVQLPTQEQKEKK